MWSFSFIEIQLIYNILLVSGIQQNDSVIFFKLYSIIGYSKTLSIIPSAKQ